MEVIQKFTLSSDIGMIQGSILGPVLYGILILPLFGLTQITNFTDDTIVILWKKILSNLILNLKRELEMIIKLLKDSCPRVNSSKIEICLFHVNDQPDTKFFLTANLIGVSKWKMPSKKQRNPFTPFEKPRKFTLSNLKSF
jgi:hypothetical protein